MATDVATWRIQAQLADEVAFRCRGLAALASPWQYVRVQALQDLLALVRRLVDDGRTALMLSSDVVETLGTHVLAKSGEPVVATEAGGEPRTAVDAAEVHLALALLQVAALHDAVLARDVVTLETTSSWLMRALDNDEDESLGEHAVDVLIASTVHSPLPAVLDGLVARLMRPTGSRRVRARCVEAMYVLLKQPETVSAATRAAFVRAQGRNSEWLEKVGALRVDLEQGVGAAREVFASVL